MDEKTKIFEHEKAFFRTIAKGAVSGPYLLYGDEEYSKEQAVRKIVELTGEAARDLNVTTFKAPALEPSDIINACNSLPFFDERKVVIVRDYSAFTENALVEYLPSVPDTTILLFVYLGAVKKKSPVHDYLKQNLPEHIVQFAPYPPENAVAFVLKRARENEILIGRAEANYLVQYAGTDLGGLLNNLLKAGSFAGAGNPVTREIIETCVTPAAEYKFYIIGDQLLGGNLSGGMQQLMNEIRNRRQQPLPFLYYLAKRVRELITIRQMKAAGKTNAEIKKFFGYKYDSQLNSAVSLARKRNTAEFCAILDGISRLISSVPQGTFSDKDAMILAIYQLFTEEKR